ncbi:hypothetical protein SAMN05421890_0347 [Ensifer adhaerens]|nr:hypothetical protein SAMN05421890_0347 [Ensifer adhaerens]
MRVVSAVIWALAAALSFLLTLGNVSLVGFQQKAQASLRDADLNKDLYATDLLSIPTRWTSECLSEGLRVRKDLQLKQLDLLFGHEPLAASQKRLEQTLEFLRSYLHCNPGDGTAWLAAAMVMNTINNDSDVTMQYLALSKFYMPDSEAAVRSRSAILRNVSARLKSNYQDLFMESVPLKDQ